MKALFVSVALTLCASMLAAAPPTSASGPRLPSPEEREALLKTIGDVTANVFKTWLVNGLHMILFARQGAKDGEGGALSTSLEELYRVRADEAADGGLVTIGSRRFYTLGQGGKKGSVLFFSKEAIDKRSDFADARHLAPEAMADVTEVDENGATVPVRGMPDLGVVDGVAYHLEYDATVGFWRVAPGAGDRP